MVHKLNGKVLLKSAYDTIAVFTRAISIITIYDLLSRILHW